MNRRSAIDARTTSHSGYTVSQQKRKRVEEIFGWANDRGLFRQTRRWGCAALVGCSRSPSPCTNLVRIRSLTWAEGAARTARSHGPAGPPPSASGYRGNPSPADARPEAAATRVLTERLLHFATDTS